ncbi:hypothetical protein PV11_02267 [Exophiala sideris]|uniref:Uncharacterized protein n=1 Tax=Exophiala sideris TaxID=1016849 RepID=A0A0D1WD57_9EURO|nr:hypothetical protein PV11_02267 [Exophiala sideris]
MSPQPYDPIGANAISNMKFTFSHKIGSVSYFILSDTGHQEPPVSKVESSGRDPPSLLILPPEIRSMIYRYVFDELKLYTSRTLSWEGAPSAEKKYHLKRKILPENPFALLRTSKEIYNEAEICATFRYFSCFIRGYQCPVCYKPDYSLLHMLSGLRSFTADMQCGARPLRHFLRAYDAVTCPSLRLIDISVFATSVAVPIHLPAVYMDAYLDNELYKSKFVDVVFQLIIRRKLRTSLGSSVLKALNLRNITLKFKIRFFYWGNIGHGLPRMVVADVVATWNKDMFTILTLMDTRKEVKACALDGHVPRFWYETSLEEKEFNRILPRPVVGPGPRNSID